MSLDKQQDYAKGEAKGTQVRAFSSLHSLRLEWPEGSAGHCITVSTTSTHPQLCSGKPKAYLAFSLPPLNSTPWLIYFFVFVFEKIIAV